MTPALILTASSHTIACAYCNAPWPIAVAQCPGCGLREEEPAATQVVAPSPDDLRAQLAAVTVERDALRALVGEKAVGTTARPTYGVIHAQPVGGDESGASGWLVSLDCGHRKAVREKRARYECRACNGPAEVPA